MICVADKPLFAKNFFVSNVADQVFELASYLLIDVSGGLCLPEILIELTLKFLCFHNNRSKVHLFKKSVSFRGFEFLHKLFLEIIYV